MAVTSRSNTYVADDLSIEANACVRVGGKFSESVAVEVGVRQG